MIESESGDRQSQTRMLFCWKLVEILVIISSSTLFLSHLQARKENPKLLNFLKYSTVAPDSSPDSQLKAAGLKLIDRHLRSVNWS